MANANMIELETSLAECIRYCEAHPTAEPSRLFKDRLVAAQHNLASNVQNSDTYHVKWRAEELSHLKVWKELSKLINTTKRRLRSINALGVQGRQVMYWDREILKAEAETLKAYLHEHASSIDFAQDTIERIDRFLDAANLEQSNEERALKDFQRFVSMRREAISDAGSVIGEFRVAMRRILGKNDPEYQGIFWPYAIASDSNVLF